MTDLTPMNADAQTALEICEQRIERGLKTFVEVGEALAAIRDGRLYRGTHRTFEDYAVERWSLSRAHAYRMIAAAEVVSPIGDTGLPLPTSEGQARALAKVPEPERADVWRDTVERTEGKPTAAAIRESAERRDARALLRRIVDLAWSPNWPEGHVEHWAAQLGPYDEELQDLTKRALEAIAVLDVLVEQSGGVR